MRSPRISSTCLNLILATTAALTATSAKAVTIFNDAFDDGVLTTNTGTNAVGSTNAWTPQVGGFPGHQAGIVEADGRVTIAGTSNTTPYALGQINSRNRHSYAPFNDGGATFTYTLSNMLVANANTATRTDVPGAGLGAVRYELGVISNADSPDAVDELYRADTGGGFFVSLWKDAAGLLTGNVRVVNELHQPAMEFVSDSEGAAGLKTLASFALPGINGVDAFTVAFHLDAAGYTLAVNETPVAAGSYGLRADGTTPFLTEANFATGTYLTASGQGWGTGYGSVSIDNLTVTVVPEPTTLLGLAFAGTWRRRR